MAKWDYAAIVPGSIWFTLNESPNDAIRRMGGLKHEGWFLLSDLTFLDNSGVSIPCDTDKLLKSDKKLGELFSKVYTDIGHERNAAQRFLDHSKEVIKATPVSDFNPGIHGVIWTPTEHVKFRLQVEHYAPSVLELVQLMAENGWETTGQIPSFTLEGNPPRPSGITMMRRKV